jgi:hypothetical protein
VSGSCYLQALAIVDKRADQPSNRRETGPCPFETCPPSHVPFTMTSVAFPKSIFSELAANLPRHACRTGESITMSSNRSWLNVGITSLFNGKIGLTLLFLLLALPAFGAGGACPSAASYGLNGNATLSSLGVTSCYYVAANGSDSNNGISESSPWLHAPQMPNCSANCATVQNGTLPAGTGLILRGGDTWHFGDSGDSPYTGGTWNFNVEPYPMGTSSNPIYVGVDQTWHSGSAWARPILNGDNPINPSTTLSSCSYQMGSLNNFFELGGLQYYIIDNFEMTGMCQSDVGQPSHHDIYISYGGLRNSMTFQNLYIHGWSHVQFAASNGSSGCTGSTVCVNIFAFNGSVSGSSVGEIVHNNVVDGSDSDPGGAGLCFGGFYDVAYNVFRYTSQCVVGQLHLFHDNLYEYFYENGHSNVLESMAETAGANAVYNNVFRHLETAGVVGCGSGNNPPCSGGVGLWPLPASGTTDYFFNNLMYDVGSMEVFNIGNHGSTLGNYTVFNNTFQTNVNQPVFGCQYLSGGSLADVNNHFIDNGTQYSSPCNNKTTTTPLLQTNAQADSNISVHFDQYTASEPQGYSPVVSTNSTVIAGTNVYSSMCGALGAAGLTAAQTACESNTTYACSYAGNGAAPVCPAGTLNARPPSGVWDVGAYEFNSQNPPPNPPTGLTAVVN